MLTDLSPQIPQDRLVRVLLEILLRDHDAFCTIADNTETGLVPEYHLTNTLQRPAEHVGNLSFEILQNEPITSVRFGDIYIFLRFGDIIHLPKVFWRTGPNTFCHSPWNHGKRNQ
jgi:hypothetical protein